MVRETSLSPANLIFPLFLIDGQNRKTEVNSMPGIFRLSADLLLKEIEACLKLGITTFDLFPNLEESLKDTTASESLNEKGLYLKTLRLIKKELPEAVIMTDVAMDPYSSDGHDGFVKNGEILNDETLEILAKISVIVIFSASVPMTAVFVIAANGSFVFLIFLVFSARPTTLCPVLSTSW